MSSSTAQIHLPELPGDASDAELCFVYFGNDCAAENRTSSHHLARCLSQTFPVLYVEAPGFRAPQASKRDLKKIFRKLVLALRGPRRVSERMWQLTLPQIPFHGLRWVRWLNAALGGFSCRRAMRRAGLRAPILWFMTPHVQHLTGSLESGSWFTTALTIGLRCRMSTGAPFHKWTTNLPRKPASFLSPPGTLLNLKKDLNPTATYSPHGVDFELFRKAADGSLPIARGARDLRHPIIGFFGLIDTWFDSEFACRNDHSAARLDLSADRPGGNQHRYSTVRAQRQNCRYSTLPDAPRLGPVFRCRHHSFSAQSASDERESAEIERIPGDRQTRRVHVDA